MNTLLALQRLATTLWEEGNRWASRLIRFMVFTVIVWPMLMIAVSFVPWLHPVATVSILGLLPVFAILGILCFMPNPLLVGLMFMMPTERMGSGPGKPTIRRTIHTTAHNALVDARKPLTLVIGTLLAEMLISLYFAFVPVANDRELVFSLVLCAMAFAFAGRIPVIRLILGLVILGITLTFFLKGKGVWAKIENVGAAAIPKPSAAPIPTTAKPSAAGYSPKSEQPLCSGRATDCQNTGTPPLQDHTTLTPPPAPIIGAHQKYDGLTLVIYTPCRRRRLNEAIKISCDGAAINEGDLPVSFSLEEGGYATDNRGNQARIYRIGGIEFGGNGDWHAELEKDMPINFHLTFDDASLGIATRVQVQLRTSHGGKDPGITDPFDPVPIS